MSHIGYAFNGYNVCMDEEDREVVMLDSKAQPILYCIRIVTSLRILPRRMIREILRRIELKHINSFYNPNTLAHKRTNYRSVHLQFLTMLIL